MKIAEWGSTDGSDERHWIEWHWSCELLGLA
jgi:hypothetical protein